MKLIRLTIAYDGTNYAGWQVQPEEITVQGEIEAAIERLSGERARVHGSGRTDAGVHALGQVAHFQTAATIPPERWRPALNGTLPRDIVIVRSEDAPPDFHARYSAKRKTYRYLIQPVVSSSPLPWLRNHIWQMTIDSTGETLDVDSMRRAARCLIGTHDFASFESKSSPEESSVRTVFELELAELSRWEPWITPLRSTFPPDVMSVTITADGFLYNMVRSIVGTLVEIGQGRRAEDDMMRILAACNRSQAGATAPPQGLYLIDVDYGEMPRRPASEQEGDDRPA